MKLILLVGCMASGKDTLLNKIVEGGLARPIVSHTSRPMRKGETQGKEYHFVSKEEMLKMKEENKFIEFKTYKVANGDTWYYGISEEEFGDNNYDNYITIVDIDGMRQIKEHVKNMENCEVITIFLHADRYIRMKRAMNRDDMSQEKINEILRRFDDDDKKVYPFRNECTYCFKNEDSKDFKCNYKQLEIMLTYFPI